MLENFKGLKHFDPDEAWGDPSKISRDLLVRLDAWREYTGAPFYVTFGTQGKHVGPWHGLGLAVDGVVDVRGGSKLDLVLQAERFNFTGMGLYPMARHPTCATPFGFHFDVRPIGYVKQNRWIATRDPNGRNLIDQHPFDEAHLRLFGII